MYNNFFTREQLVIIYSDKEFLNFLSSYYSTYNVDQLPLNLNLHSSELDEYWNTYLRILLANINEFIKIVDDILKKPSYVYKEIRKKYVGEIKGRLAVNEYVQNKTFVKMPAEYPCIIKNKSFDNDENLYVVYSILKIKRIIDKLERMFSKSSYKKSTEYIKLREKKNVLNTFIKNSIFSSFFRNNIANSEPSFSPAKIMNLLNQISKGKIKNGASYKRLLEWMKKYEQQGITWIDDNSIETLIYDDGFSDRLFEILNVYLLKKNFVKDRGFSVVESNKLVPALSTYLFKLQKDEIVIEIYYQHGKNLYWNDSIKQNWHYDSGEYLVGIPDISILKITNYRSIYLIDAKNKIREKGENSDEIYKLIGYYNNFQDFFKKEYPKYLEKKAFLLFRNDIKDFKESVIDSKNNSITCLSIGVGDSSLNENQIKCVCDSILM